MEKEWVSALLLAAGKASRMGRPKLLMVLGKSTILETTLDHLLESAVSEVIVVVGPEATRMCELIKGRPVKLVVNPHYAEGMSTSLISGLLEVDPRASWVLVALGDEPLVDSATYTRLIEASRGLGRGLLVPVYKGIRGNPVLISLAYRQELLELTEDGGGRILFERHPDEVYEVPVDCPGVLQDVNTMQDYLSITGGNLC